MKPLRLFLSLAAFCLGNTFAHAAGFAFIDVPADKDGPALHGAVWTPCAAPAVPIVLDSIVLSGVRDCPVPGTRLPLIVISHGTGGSFVGHRDTAETLADAGFVVAAINHPGDNFKDLSRQADLSVFASRPVDMRRLVDYMLGAWPKRASLAADQVGIFGFSRGGFTALAAVGAVPDFALREDLCPPGAVARICDQIHHREFPPAPVRDPRIKAAVVVDPLSAFDARGLKQVTVPVQLWASEFGGDGVLPHHVAAVRRDLPTPPEWHVAAHGAHFGFLAPCSAAMTKALPELCTDGPGFDRVAFHAGFDAEVRDFFQRQLMQAPQS